MTIEIVMPEQGSAERDAEIQRLRTALANAREDAIWCAARTNSAAVQSRLDACVRNIDRALHKRKGTS